MANINIDKLAAEIAKGLAEYSQDVVEKVNVSSERIGKAAVKRLKQTSPKRYGKYAKSWTMKTDRVLQLDAPPLDPDGRRRDYILMCKEVAADG